MKKLLLCVSSAMLTVATFGAVISTNLNMTSLRDGVFNLTTNRASVYNVQLANANATYPATLEFYDIANLGIPWYGTNYAIVGNITNMVTYTTNYTYSFTGYNGYTNWYTNNGTWTTPVVTLNGTTNKANPIFTLSVGPSTVANYDVNGLFVNGVSVRCIGATNVQTTLFYRSGQ